MNQSKGFTLIELIIAVGVISILVSIGTISYRDLQLNARNAKRKADLQEIKTVLNAYYADYGAYPTTNPALSWRGACSHFGSEGDVVPALINRGYLQQFPRDPLFGLEGNGCTAAQRCYIYRSTGTEYKVLAYCGAEGNVNPNDPMMDKNATRPTDRPSWAVYGGTGNNVKNW